MVVRQSKSGLKETDFLLQISGGDARKLLNALEYVVNSQKLETQIVITNALCKNILKEN